MDIAAESLEKYWQTVIKRATLEQLSDLNDLRLKHYTNLSADDSGESAANYLSLRISFDFSGSEEMAGITKFHIDIYKDDEIGEIPLIGKMIAYKFDRNQISDILEVLDYSGETAPFMELFDDSYFKDKVLKAAHSDDIFANLLILSRLEILPEYRGRNYAGDIFNLIDKSIGSDCLTAMIAFPLQFEGKGDPELSPAEAFGRNWREKMSLESFLQDEKTAVKKLTGYYRKFGFTKVPRCTVNFMVRQLKK